MERHGSCIGFMVYISNADKHRERFAVRAKYMALDQRSNRYIKFFDNIRLIQVNPCGIPRGRVCWLMEGVLASVG